MGGTLLWFGVYCAWALLFFAVIWPWAKGRLPADRYHEHLNSPEWAATWAKLETKRRGRRCAACGTTDGLGHPHHVTYASLGYESTWQLVRLCRRDHRRVHQWSEWVFSSRTRGLWFTTGVVAGAGKLARLGRRTPDRVTVR